MSKQNKELTKLDIMVQLAKERLESIDIDGYDKPYQHYDIDFKPNQFEKCPTEEEFIKKLGRQWKKNLCLLGSFFEEYKHITSNYLDDSSKPVSILNIATTNNNLLSIYKSQKTVSNVLKLLQKVNGLVKVYDSYRFNSKINFSKKYAYNKSIEKLTMHLVKKHQINIIKTSTSLGDIFESYKDDFKFDPEKYYKVRVSSKLKVAHITEEQAISILNRRYKPLLDSRLPKIKELNEHLPSERQIKFKWNLNFSKTGFLTKAGIRATNKLVSLKEHENNNLEYKGKWRHEYLKENGFDKASYDKHGSIFATAHLLHTGEFVPNSVDPYREIYGREITSEQRACLKSMAMPLYFDRTNCIINHNKRRIPKCLEEFKVEGLQPVINDYAEQMWRYTGDSLDSEIFLHESLIYIDLVYELYKLGIDCVQIYDGFYFDKYVSESKIEKLLRVVSEKYYQDYLLFLDQNNNNNNINNNINKRYTNKKQITKRHIYHYKKSSGIMTNKQTNNNMKAKKKQQKLANTAVFHPDNDIPDENEQEAAAPMLKSDNTTLHLDNDSLFNLEIEKLVDIYNKIYQKQVKARERYNMTNSLKLKHQQFVPYTFYLDTILKSPIPNVGSVLLNMMLKCKNELNSGKGVSSSTKSNVKLLSSRLNKFVANESIYFDRWQKFIFEEA